MKKVVIIMLSVLAIIFASCDGKVSPETANAFKGEYWMETTSTTMNGESAVDEGRTIWTPVSIYEKGGALYVQTELLGAPDTISEHPQGVQGTRERPFAPRRVKAEDEPGGGGIENVETSKLGAIVVRNGFICAINRGVNARTFPIKVKSGSETVLNLEAYKPVDVQLTDMDGNALATIKAWYDYGPMVKNGDVITWEVQFKDNYNHNSEYGSDWTHVIHKNTLYKK